MTYHIHSHHTGDKPYHCPDCKCTFILEANLNTHCRVRDQVQSVPTISSHSTCVVHVFNSKNHYCTTCGKNSHIIVIYCLILVHILEKNPLYVRTVGKVLLSLVILLKILVFILERNFKDCNKVSRKPLA